MCVSIYIYIYIYNIHIVSNDIADNRTSIDNMYLQNKKQETFRDN